MHSRSILVTVVVSLLASGCLGISVERRSASYEGYPAAAPERGFVRIHGDPVARDRAPGSATEVSVSYHNDTESTFSVVTVWCRALDAEGYQLGAASRTLLGVAVGPMEPGFKTRWPLVIDLEAPGAVDEVVCEVTGAR